MTSRPEEKNETNDNSTNYGVAPDNSSEYDTIGFKTYTEAFRFLLEHPTTNPPLTVSVEGSWGSGKTSFMDQVKRQLDENGFKTIKFNPWRHESEESLWAAFVLEFLRQLRSKDDFNLINRISSNLKLYRLRLSKNGGYAKLMRNLIGLFAIFLLAVGAGIAMLEYLQNYLQTSGESVTLVRLIVGSSGVLVALSALLTLMIKSGTHFINPIRSSISEYVHNPQYTERQSFITKFHNEFDKIINSHTGTDEKIFVFIDDLDRCEVPKAADLIQAINLLTESRPNLIFIIGIDRPKVAAGIAAKHEDIIEHLDEGINEQSESDDPDEVSGKEFGYNYLEKFIQLPFRLPTPEENNVGDLLIPQEEDAKKKRKKQNLSTKEIRDQMDDRLEEMIFSDSEILSDISEMIVPALESNPRRIKKFGNIYRLQAILADRRSSLQFGMSVGEEFDPRITLHQLAKFVAMEIQWRQFTSLVRARPDILPELEDYAIGKTEYENLSSSAQDWAQNRKLMELISYGLEGNKNTQRYSFKSVDLKNLFSISASTEVYGIGAQADGTKEYEKLIEEKFSMEINIFGLDINQNEKVASVVDEILSSPEESLGRVVNYYHDFDQSSMAIEGVEKPIDLLDIVSPEHLSDIILKMYRMGMLKEDSDHLYLNEDNKIVSVLQEVTNDVSSGSFKKRVNIVQVFAKFPNSTISVDSLITISNYSKNSIHHQLTQLHKRNIIEEDSTPAELQGHSDGYTLNLENQTARHIMTLANSTNKVENPTRFTGD